MLDEDIFVAEELGVFFASLLGPADPKPREPGVIVTLEPVNI